jgi:pimeloyl-ACP methyl ester carboxylesterase
MTPTQPLELWITHKPEWHLQTLAFPADNGLAIRGAYRPGTGVLRVYIEGDGRSYITPDMPSADPTPGNPVALKLALADATGRPVVYLARPCQWKPDNMTGTACQKPYLWTRGRYTEEVAASYAALVAGLAHGGPVEVVGYSGGGWVAMQVASRVPNVVRVITVAGNVLPNSFNMLHHVPDFPVAPYPDMKRLEGLPQVHYVGTQDKIVPRWLLEIWRGRMGAPASVTIQSVPATHGEGWENLRL